MSPQPLYHFSEEQAITRFEPRVSLANPTQPPAVWAIDAEHAPLYWFPRECPRVSVWSRNDGERRAFRHRFQTTADRLHAIELGWLDRMRTTTLYRYDLPPASFRPWGDVSGQYIADATVEPLAVTVFDDLLSGHVEANIELRLVPSLWPLIDEVTEDEFDFSIVRKHNAAHRLT
jgi:hypothetical protein